MPSLVISQEIDEFPCVISARTSPNQFVVNEVCQSKGLSTDLVLKGYRAGAFPWPSQEESATGMFPWCRPQPATVLRPSDLHLSHSMKKRLADAKAKHYDGSQLEIVLDYDFPAFLRVLQQEHRRVGSGTWLSDHMIEVWSELHRQNHAHSVEVWVGGKLVGGLYGTTIGQMFYGESMFHVLPDISKLALVALCALLRSLKIPLVDCQAPTEHLLSLGAKLLDVDVFLSLNHFLSTSKIVPNWAQWKEQSLLELLNSAYPDISPRQPSKAQLARSEERCKSCSEFEECESTMQAAEISVPRDLECSIRSWLPEGASLSPYLLNGGHVSLIEEPCGYFSQKKCYRWGVQGPDDAAQLTKHYDLVLERGWRRIGRLHNWLDCPSCRRCVPLRIPLNSFAPDRTMKKVLRKNAHLLARWVPVKPYEEHWALYQRYLQYRHADSEMLKEARYIFEKGVIGDHPSTHLLEFRELDAHSPYGQLRMVCIIDVLDHALSAVYNFYDPDLLRKSIGIYGILTEIKIAQTMRRDYLYLGHWLPGYSQMDYKARFKGAEVFWEGEWMSIADFSQKISTEQLDSDR